MATGHTATANSSKNNCFGTQHPARFHKSPCLHSIAVRSLRFGKMSKDQTPAESIVRTNKSEKPVKEVQDFIEDLWSKKSTIADCNTTLLDCVSNIAAQIYRLLWFSTDVSTPNLPKYSFPTALQSIKPARNPRFGTKMVRFEHRPSSQAIHSSPHHLP